MGSLAYSPMGSVADGGPALVGKWPDMTRTDPTRCCLNRPQSTVAIPNSPTVLDSIRDYPRALHSPWRGRDYQHFLEEENTETPSGEVT